MVREELEREGGEWKLVWVALCEEGREQALWACKAGGVQGGGCARRGVCKAGGVCEVVGCVKRMCKMEECAWWRWYKVHRVCEVEGVREQEA